MDGTHTSAVRVITGEVWVYFVDLLQWSHKRRDGVSNHQPHHCLLKRLYWCKSKKTSKLRVTGLCAGNSSVTGEFPAQMASNAENVSIWWRHHDLEKSDCAIWGVHCTHNPCSSRAHLLICGSCSLCAAIMFLYWIEYSHNVYVEIYVATMYLCRLRLQL